MKYAKLKSTLGLGVVALAVALPGVVNAQSKYAVTTENLNFRKGPSTSHAIITTIKKNTKVEIISVDGSWAKIKYNNTVGYSNKNYLKDVSSSDTTETKTGKVTANPRLNVRNGAGTGYRIVAKAEYGTKVTVLETKNGWHKIKLPNGTIGWGSADYIKIDNTSSGGGSTTNPDNGNNNNGNNNSGNSSNSGSTQTKSAVVTANPRLNVRSGAGTSYSIVAKADYGTKVTVLETKNGWHKIKLSNGTVGWGSADYIKIDSTSSGGGSTTNPDNGNNNNGNNNSGNSSNSGSTQTKSAVVTASPRLNVRSGAGTSYSIVAKADYGTKVTVLETKNGWHKIKLSNGTIGWGSADYIKIDNTSSGGGSTTNPDNGNNNNGSVETKSAVVTASPRLNVRSGAGTSYSIVAKADYGTKVTVLETKNGWHKIKLPNGTIGWGSADYIKIDGESNNGSGSTTNPGTGQTELPQPTATPTYVDAPYNSLVMDATFDQYQNLVQATPTINGGLKSLSIKTNGSFNVEYSTYGNGGWVTKQDGVTSSNSGANIEGVRIKLKNAPANHHIFYRVKVAGQGWQNWVKDGTISGEISNGKYIEAIETRVVVSDNADAMVKPTLAIDLGHNVSRPTTFGAANGIYSEDYLIREVGKKVIYKLRSMGYNVVETLPQGNYSQNQELSLRAKTANANEVSKFVSIHFNSGPAGAHGTEVYYSSRAGSKNMATQMVANLSNSFNFRNRGAKNGDHLYVLNSTNMPAVLVEGCFLDPIDMNKFIAKGSQAYDIMAQAIIDGIF